MKLICKKSDGIGLVELLIYTALSLIVLSAVGGVVISLVNVQNQVMNTASAAEQSQLVARTIEAGVRNATAIDLQTVNSSDQMLSVRTASATGTAVWSCRVWYFSLPNKSLFTRTSNTAIGVPTQQGLAGWTLLAVGVSPPQGQQIFTLSGTKVGVYFAEQVAKETPIFIKTSVSQRGGVRISAPCF